MTGDHPQLVGHRGYMARYPENSWSGMRAAIDAGALWLECDIQMMNPGEFIVLHDRDLARTAADPRPIFGLSGEQRQAISIHEPGRLGNRFQGEPLLRLEELLSRLRTFPKVRIMVEIKEESLQQWGLEAVMSPLLSILQPYRNQAVLISFSLQALQYAASRAELELGWVLESYTPNSLTQARDLAPAFLIIDHAEIPQGTVPEPGPWRWMLYDITDPEQALAWYRRGVELIETGDIGTLTRAFREGLGDQGTPGK